MDPNKWVIFAYDREPAHGDSAIPPALYVQSPGGYFRNFWVGMCHWDPGTLNLYQS